MLKPIWLGLFETVCLVWNCLSGATKRQDYSGNLLSCLITDDCLTECKLDNISNPTWMFPDLWLLSQSLYFFHLLRLLPSSSSVHLLPKSRRRDVSGSLTPPRLLAGDGGFCGAPPETDVGRAVALLLSQSGEGVVDGDGVMCVTLCRWITSSLKMTFLTQTSISGHQPTSAAQGWYFILQRDFQVRT